MWACKDADGVITLYLVNRLRVFRKLPSLGGSLSWLPPASWLTSVHIQKGNHGVAMGYMVGSVCFSEKGYRIRNGNDITYQTFIHNDNS